MKKIVILILFFCATKIYAQEDSSSVDHHTNIHRSYGLMSIIYTDLVFQEIDKKIEKHVYEFQRRFGAHIFRDLRFEYKYYIDAKPTITSDKVIFYSSMLNNDNLVKATLFDALSRHLNFDPQPHTFWVRVKYPNKDLFVMGTHAFKFMIGDTTKTPEMCYEHIIEEGSAAYIASQSTGYMLPYDQEVLNSMSIFEQLVRNERITLGDIIYFQRENNLRGFFEKGLGKKLSDDDLVEILVLFQDSREEKFKIKKTYKKIMRI